MTLLGFSFCFLIVSLFPCGCSLRRLPAAVFYACICLCISELFLSSCYIYIFLVAITVAIDKVNTVSVSVARII